MPFLIPNLPATTLMTWCFYGYELWPHKWQEVKVSRNKKWNLFNRHYFFSSSMKKCLVSGLLTKSMALPKLNWEIFRPLSLQRDSNCLIYTVCCQVSGGRYQYSDTWNKNWIFEAPFSKTRICFNFLKFRNSNNLQRIKSN